jgi:hypothetical protein
LSHPVFAKLLELLMPAADPVDHKDRSEFERLALPGNYKPRLSFAEAVVSVVTTLTRIFLGSLLFAVWGIYSLLAWKTIGEPFLRVVVLLPLLLLFFLFFALLMIAISAIQKVIFQHLP